MKFTADKAGLTRAFAMAGKVQPGRNIPGAEGFKLNLTGSTLTITGTTGAAQIRERLEVLDAQGEGEVVAPRKIAAAVKAAEGEEISICVEKRAIRVKSGPSVVRMAGADPAEFPLIAWTKENGRVLMDGAVLKALIERTAYAAAADGAQQKLNGCFLSCKGREVQLVGMDAIRMAVNTAQAKEAGGEAEAIIPAGAMRLLESICNAPEVEISFHPPGITARAGNTELSAATITGEYVKYQRLVELERPTKLSVDREELCRAVERALLTEGKKIELEAEEGILQIASRDAETEVRSELAVSQSGPAARVRLIAPIVLQAIRACGGSRIWVETGNDATTLFRAGAGIHIVSPMRR